jgi:molybdopterin molybdotransferase
MTTYEEALAIILANTQVLDVEEKELLKCRGQVLAEDVYTDYDLPLMDQAGPDGYAVRSADIQAACQSNPVTLRILATVRAGFVPRDDVKPGTAIRIMTGSVMPKGADCVVRFEDTDEPANKCGPNKAKPKQVKIYVSVAPGQNMRPAGSNVKKGSLVLSKCVVLGPAQISALTTVGKARVKVIRRPVIGIISTGDELIPLGTPMRPGKTYSGNADAATALIAHYGGKAVGLGIARDTQKSIMTKMQKALALDAIVTIGGVSQGDYDLVRVVIDQIGKVIFAKIKMGPGASMAYGRVNAPSSDNPERTIPVFALAGPPAGCMINCETLLRPAIFKMMGNADLSHPIVRAKAKGDSPNTKPLAFVKWTKLAKVNGEYYVDIDDAEDPSPLATLARGNSLTIIPAGKTVESGDVIPVLPLDWCRDSLTWL